MTEAQRKTALQNMADAIERIENDKSIDSLTMSLFSKDLGNGRNGQVQITVVTHLDDWIEPWEVVVVKNKN